MVLLQIKDNQTAVFLYQSLGFREVEKSKEDTLSKDICYMAKRLSFSSNTID